MKNSALVEDIVEEMAFLGIISFVTEKPLCVSPLGLVSKTTPGGNTKHRLVFDASRWLNIHIDPPAVKLTYLQRALESITKGDWLGLFDLQSAYYHIKVFEAHRQFLGACISGRKGTRYFVYNHLPFGLNSAVHVITKVFKPILAYLRSQDVTLSVYIDDGLIVSSSQAKAERDRILVYDVLAKAGWFIEPSKSDGPDGAEQSKCYLGFDVDSKSMMVKCPSDKLKILCDDILRQSALPVLPIKLLASLLGKIASLEPSHGPLARICTRSGYICVARHVDAHGWKGQVPVSEQSLAEIRYFCMNAERFNSYPIRTALTDISLEVLLPGAISRTDQSRALRTIPDTLMVSDASAFKVASIMLEGPASGRSWAFTLSDLEQKASSGYRELLAVQKTLLQFKSEHLLNMNILWLTDSENVVSFLTKGSSKAPVQLLVFDCLLKAKGINCHIDPIHLLREDPRIQVADFDSKVRDTDNWSIDHASFEALHVDFVFDVDLFADASNARVNRFASKYFDALAIATDAFTIPWNGVCWICPPVSLLPRVAKRIRASNCQGVVIVPNWPASSFMPAFFTSDMTPRPPFKFWREFRPYIIQNEGAKSTPLYGFTAFSFFALYFDTT